MESGSFGKRDAEKPLNPPQVLLSFGRGNIVQDENNSPESVSLYSDEIPSGYNSGEQYDTLSTGYMSGEAYELPETRMDLQASAALGVIHESHLPGGGGGPYPEDLDSDAANIFVLQPSKADSVSLSSSSSSGTSNVGAAAPGLANIDVSPNYNSKGKLRKTTFAIPMENALLLRAVAVAVDADDYGFGAESSDAGQASAPTGGYRTVPSDTDDTSDANSKGGRRRMRKQHDEDWFDANDSKPWSIGRQVCFWLAIASMVCASLTAAVLIYFMPRQCDPPHEWFQGSVFMDLRPRLEGNKYLFDLEAQRLQEIASLGIRAVHLKGLTAKVDSSSDQDGLYHSTDTFLHSYGDVFGLSADKLENALSSFVSDCHANNLSVLIQIPVVGLDDESVRGVMSVNLEFAVTRSIEFWAKRGVDGVFLDGLEHFGKDGFVAQTVTSWSSAFKKFGGKTGVLMTSYLFAHSLQESVHADQAMSHIHLLDASFDVYNTSALVEKISSIAAWDSIGSRPWINWNLLQYPQNASKAALAFQFLLPGTVSVPGMGMDGKIAKLDAEILGNLIAIRNNSVPIYMNGNYKRCECEGGIEKEPNFEVKEPAMALLQLERFYSRRNRFLLVSNFGDEKSSLLKVADMYSAGELVVDTSNSLKLHSEVKIADLILEAGHAFVIKLPK